MTQKQLRRWFVALSIVVVVVSLSAIGFSTNDGDVGHVALFFLIAMLPAGGVLALWMVVVRARNRNLSRDDKAGH